MKLAVRVGVGEGVLIQSISAVVARRDQNVATFSKTSSTN
jgi:hypothetical protein